MSNAVNLKTPREIDAKLITVESLEDLNHLKEMMGRLEPDGKTQLYRLNGRSRTRREVERQFQHDDEVRHGRIQRPATQIDQFF